MDPLESLRAEKALIEKATRLLDSGNAAGATKVLGEHARRFRNGQLTAERIGTEVLALCALGKAEAARKEAARFMSRFADHPMADRVAAACAQ
jgi:outer membrane protein assembly factor BamD (BamD/ComL family)